MFVIFPSLLVSIIVGCIWPKIGAKLFLGWSTAILLIVLLGILDSLIKEMKLVEQHDIIGEYIIDRSMFPGKNSNWQYDHYRLEVTDKNMTIKYFNSGHFHSEESVEIRFLEYYKNNRIKVVGESLHHMLQEHPLLVREGWSYYYVINSYRYGNMYFRKGKWKKR